MSTPMNVFDNSLKPTRVFRWRSLCSIHLAPISITVLAIIALASHSGGLWLPLPLLALAAASAAAFQLHGRRADAVVVIGRSPIAAMIASSLESGLDAGGSARRQPLAVLRAVTWTETAALIRSRRINEIIVTESLIPATVDVTDIRGRRPAIVNGVDKLESVLGRVPLELAAQDHWFDQMDTIRPLSSAFQQSKRALDVLFVIAVGLIVLPVAPLIALAIAIDSRGPVFYSQQRVGLGGRAFRIYKFRTMRQDAEREGAVWACLGDPRVTRVGRFMRLTRIDELPQIWNVLQGEMSVVGPRPERPEFTSELAKEIAGYELRHAVKPGLTGWAQVCFRYTNSVHDTKSKVEYDLYYVKHLSLGMDIRILFRTIKVVLGMKGQ